MIGGLLEVEVVIWMDVEKKIRDGNIIELL